MMGGYGGCCGLGWFGSLGGFGWVGVFLNALFVIGLIVLTVWLVRRITMNVPRAHSSGARPDHQATPGEVLAVRYARGEIDRDQYKSMLADLE